MVALDERGCLRGPESVAVTEPLASTPKEAAIAGEVAAELASSTTIVTTPIPSHVLAMDVLMADSIPARHQRTGPQSGPV
ncbi:hypothetical protein BRAO375_1240009 [Bradyrhizobium sp. ORS 375]|nr:hypothetical protein BRAO375_1240009 [Bradyrhizobium sp. ORS 375]